MRCFFKSYTVRKWIFLSLCFLSISGGIIPFSSLRPSSSSSPSQSSPPRRTTPAKTYPQEGDQCRTKTGYVAAITEALLDQSFEVLRQGDTTAYARFLATGTVVQMAADVPVYIQERHVFRSTIQIRPHGHIGALWTTFDAVKCP